MKDQKRAETLFEGRPVKIFIVDEIDEDRERVVVVRANSLTFNHDVEYGDIHSDYSNFPVTKYVDREIYTIEDIRLIPFNDGTMIRYENYQELDEDERS